MALKQYLRALLERRRARKGPIIVPPEYSGKWVAWAADGRTIVAAGDSPKEAVIAAEKAGVRDGIYERIPGMEELRRMTPREVDVTS